MKRNQSGFTLVEIAIVLVIIGLLLGGVMKGQELIESTRAKSLFNDFNGISTAINGYRDRYNVLPGDDPAGLTATPHGWVFTTAPAPGGATGNGIINTTNSFTAPTAEGIAIWQELRAAGLITGNQNDATPATVLPRSAIGTPILVSNSLYGFSGPTICIQNVPAKLASIIDTKYDDGANSTGSIRAGNPGAASGNPGAAIPAAVGAASGAGSYTETGTNNFTVCRQL